MQVLLQIEFYIASNTIDYKVRVDEDHVWEIANMIRWLNQTFKEKFKIDKFVFGEIFSTYSAIASDFIFALMEEMGYDKDDKLEDILDNFEEREIKSESLLLSESSQQSKNSNYLHVTCTKTANDNEIYKKQTAESNLVIDKSISTSLNNINNSFVRVNNLFEEFEQNHETLEALEYDCSNSQNVSCSNDESQYNLLDDFKTKKM